MTRTVSTRTPIDESNLIEGVAPWMMNSIIDLVREVTTESRGRDKNGDRILRVATRRIHSIERHIQREFSYDEDNEWDLQEAVLDYCRTGDNGLDVIQALLEIGGDVMRYAYSRVFTDASLILLESGSKWMPVERGEFQAALEERVDQPTADAFGLVAEEASNPSKGLLKVAWGAAFGRNPNPSEAYGNAIKAMEAAAWPIITPNNKSATLGHIIGELRANPKKWQVSTHETIPGSASGSLSGMMQVIWDGHTDRHGTASPSPISQEAAEQAVLTAVMVCDYFNRGHVVGV